MTRRALLIVLGCAGLLLLGLTLALHRSYSPGELLAGHQKFGGNCAACHEPWRGVVASTGCVDCHGKMTSNPHSSIKVSDTDGLIAGKTLVSSHDNLTCVSCHTDHRGRIVDLAETSGGNCAWCHQHDSIEDISAHHVKQKKPMLLTGPAVQLFAKPFSHQQHLQDAIDHLLKAKQRVQTLRSPEHKQQAQVEVDALTAMLDTAGKNFNCAACHVVQPRLPNQRDKFSFASAGCAVSNCHSSWHDSDLALNSIAPQFALQQTPDSPQPSLIEYVNPGSFQFVKSEFAHSTGHLRSNCADCHIEMQDSTKPGDTHGKRVSNCFSCHAHQPESQAPEHASRGFLNGGVAMAAMHPPSGEKKITACADCHLFHLNYHGASKVKDFPKPAPMTRPNPPRGLQFAGYSLRLHFHGESLPQLRVASETWRPWGLGLIAIAILSVAAFAYVRYLPEPPALITRGNVAPQRTSEIPALDDSFQSSVPGLYVVGETAGTASINFAMRSGRQVVEFIGDALKGLKPQARADIYDVAIIGCGPAGIGATTTAKSRGLNYIALEKSTTASTIRNYPRGKFVQSTPIDINEYGAFMMEGDNSKESLVRKWEEMLAKIQIQVAEREEVVGLSRAEDVFEISTATGMKFKARFAILAIGVRGTPRKLTLSGETPDRVLYNLIEPEEYKSKSILVVGGGNAGAEVTQALANPELHNTVSYSYRGATLGPPVTRENAEKITALQQQRLITTYPASQLLEIQPAKVVLAPHKAQTGPELTAGPGTLVLTEPIELDNDVIFAMLGAELPTRLMKAFGIRMTKKGQ